MAEGTVERAHAVEPGAHGGVDDGDGVVDQQPGRMTAAQRVDIVGNCAAKAGIENMGKPAGAVSEIPGQQLQRNRRKIMILQINENIFCNVAVRIVSVMNQPYVFNQYTDDDIDVSFDDICAEFSVVQPVLRQNFHAVKFSTA